MCRSLKPSAMAPINIMPLSVPDHNIVADRILRSIKGWISYQKKERKLDPITIFEDTRSSTNSMLQPQEIGHLMLRFRNPIFFKSVTLFFVNLI